MKDGLPKEPLAAFRVKSVKSSARRGYGDNPYYDWFRDDPVVRIPFWSKTGQPVKVAIVDDNGSEWKVLDGGTPSGLAVVEYDLSADAALADAAEAKAKEKAAAPKTDKTEKPDSSAPASKAAVAAAEDEDDDADDAEKPAPPPAKKPLDPALEKLLADPLRATRKRYLAPGRYTVEIRSGGETRKTPLVIQAEKDGGGFFDGAIEREEEQE
jgi:hypothetical protein